MSDFVLSIAVVLLSVWGIGAHYRLKELEKYVEKHEKTAERRTKR